MKKFSYLLELGKKKLIKRTLQILLVFIGIIIISLTVLQVYIQNNKLQFLGNVNQKLSDAIKGDLLIKDLNINVWKHFPNAAIILNDVTVSDSMYHRPLLNVKTITGKISLLKLITKKIDIHSVTLADGNIHLFIDSTGYSNHYILSPKKEKPGKNKSRLSIEEVEFDNISIVSENAIKNKWFGVLFHQLNANIHKADTLFKISMSENATVKGLGFNLDKGYYLKDKKIEADWKLKFNTVNKELSFIETPVNINDQPFNLQGNFFLTDSLHAHFKLIVQTKSIGYKDAISLLTPNIQNKLKPVELLKPIDLYGVIEGPMAYKTIPLVNVQWTVINNHFATPVAVLQDCNFIGSFTNEKTKGLLRTDDNSEIILAGFSANWGGVILAGTNIIVTNLKQPHLQFHLTSSSKLQDLDDKFALPSFRFLGGSALLSLEYDGPLEADASILKKLSGKLAIKNGVVKYEPRELTFSNCNGDILFSENDVLVKNLRCNLNKNHFQVEIAGDNIGQIASADPGKASIICSVYSPSIDLGDFKALFGSRHSYIKRKPGAGNIIQSARQMDDILAKGTLQLQLKADNLVLDKFQAKEVNSNISFQDNKWKIQDVSLLHADGKMAMSGNIQQQNKYSSDAAMKMKLDNIDVQKLFYAFDNFGLNTLSSTNLKGVLNSTADIRVGITKTGSLVPNSLEGQVNFSLKKGALIDFEPIQNIQSFVFKNRDLSHIEFAEIKDRLDIKKDQVYIHRMEIQSSILTIFVEGIYSINNDNTDISIQVPWSNLRKRPDGYKPKNEGTDKKVGPSIYLRARSDKEGKIKLGLDVFRKLRKTKDSIP